MRGLLRALAAEGRTVFVSSHLLAEMAQLADDVVMIGRGKLITQGSVTDLTSLSSTEEVLVRAEEPERLRGLVVEHGATVAEAPERAEALLVSGMSSEDIGRAAARAGLALFELAPRRRTVEDAYLKLTADAVEYRGSVQQPVEGSRA
jgi:ABC-2 type transport system ATP-binding protein